MGFFGRLEFSCDCPGRDSGPGYYGNSIRWVQADHRFVCGRTGLVPRPAAHGDMIRDAAPYVALMEQEEATRERLRPIQEIAKEIGRSGRKELERLFKEAFDAER